MSLSWSVIKFYLGKFLNLAGYPALVRECDYESHALGAQVRVRKVELYTIISVNGIDVYFKRFTGEIDGVGASPVAGCTVPDAKTLESAHLAAPSAVPPPPPTHTRRRAG